MKKIIFVLVLAGVMLGATPEEQAEAAGRAASQAAIMTNAKKVDAESACSKLMRANAFIMGAPEKEQAYMKGCTQEVRAKGRD